MKIFLKIFWTELVFNGMETFFYGLKPLTRNNALYGADASVRARDEGEGMAGLGCRDRGRRGTRWHRGDVKKGRVWLQRCYLFSAALSKRPLAVSSDTGQVFYGSNGVNGSNGANGRCGVYGRDGRMWLIDSWLGWGEGLEL